jgi:hypothetical protein
LISGDTGGRLTGFLSLPDETLSSPASDGVGVVVIKKFPGQSVNFAVSDPIPPGLLAANCFPMKWADSFALMIQPDVN